MSQFSVSWKLSRSRFVESLDGLSNAQLNWRLQPSCLTLGESALHVAGVEVSFASQLQDTKLDAIGIRLKAAATDGVVNANPFPFEAEEITADFVNEALGYAEAQVRKMIESPSDTILQKEIVSALGPIINGEGALARLAFHAAYHQGQVYLIRNAPGFPK